MFPNYRRNEDEAKYLFLNYAAIRTFRVCSFLPTAVWTSRVYSFLPPAVWTSKNSFLPPGVWTSGVYSFLPPAVWSSKEYSFLPPAVWTSKVYSFFYNQHCRRPGSIPLYHQLYGRPGCILSTTRSMDVQGLFIFLQPAL